MISTRIPIIHMYCEQHPNQSTADCQALSPTKGANKVGQCFALLTMTNDVSSMVDQTKSSLPKTFTATMTPDSMKIPVFAIHASTCHTAWF